MFCAVATWVGVVAFRQVIAVGGVLLFHAQNIFALYSKKTGAVLAPALWMGFILVCCGLRGCRVCDNYSGNFHRGGGVAGGRLGACGVVRVINKNLDTENQTIVLAYSASHTIGIGI